MVIATEKEALTKPLSFVLKKARSSKNAADYDAKENLKNKGQKIFLLLNHIKVQIHILRRPYKFELIFQFVLMLYIM